MRFAALSLAMLILVAASFFAATAAQQQSPQEPAAQQQPGQDQQDVEQAMAEMMAQAEKYTTPGEHHKVLEKFLGRWNTEWRIIMAGESTPPAKGVMEGSWLMDGRWMQMAGDGELMGQSAEWFMLMGYDNLKMSYVTTMVQSLDTAMTRSEGDMDPSGKALISYGTLDEYLTGEHDKMVKYVWRFNSDDEIVLEVHDLPIGEANTKVMEITMTRAE